MTLSAPSHRGPRLLAVTRVARLDAYDGGLDRGAFALVDNADLVVQQAHLAKGGRSGSRHCRVLLEVFHPSTPGRWPLPPARTARSLSIARRSPRLLRA